MTSAGGARHSDEELVREIAAGSASALVELYERYATAVYSLAYHIVSDREVAEELLNDAFMRVWRQAARFDANRGKFSTWLLSVTRNLSIDSLRSQRVRPQRAAGANDSEAVLDIPDELSNVEEQVWQGQRREVIRQALRQLPAAQREAIELAYFGGLTQAEISARLGDPLGTTKTRMRLGLQKLRNLLLVEDLGAESS